MRKTLYLFCLLSNFTGGCQQKPSGVPTPTEYQYLNSFTEEEYHRDSIFLYNGIKALIGQGEGPYYVKEYDSLTEVFIDTILYSPSHDKIATFIITKNSNDKLLSKGSPNQFHYNAHCFIGRKNHIGTDWQINWFRRLNFTRHDTYNYISKKIRYRYFNNLVQLKGSDGKSQYKYNFDDIRFWEGPVWSKEDFNNPIFENASSN